MSIETSQKKHILEILEPVPKDRIGAQILGANQPLSANELLIAGTAGGYHPAALISNE